MSKEYTEIQVIQLCLERGIPNAEKKLNSFNRRGYLDNSDSVESLKKDLLTMYKTCELKKNELGKILGGKKRRYIVGEELEQKVSKKDNRKNNGANFSDFIPIIGDLILSFLERRPMDFIDTTDGEKFVITNSRLGQELNLIDVEAISHSDVLELIGENIQGQVMKYPQNITMNLHSFIRDRNRNLMHSALSFLNKNGFIDRSFRYMIYDKSGGNEISEEMYEMLKNQQKTTIDDYNRTTDKNYTVQSVSKIRYKPEQLKQEHEIEFLSYMDLHFPSVLTKANVIRVLMKGKKHLAIDYRKAYVDSLLTNAKKELSNDFENLKQETDETKRYFNLILIGLLKKLEYPLPKWTHEYIAKAQKLMGFGENKIEGDINIKPIEPLEVSDDEELDFFGEY
ncbi:hypothetical protein [Ureibacillus chungkukjangi]|uniref:Uncharacterized protein n=1 Tax=Ureibacillus chungkukjangi TaxID=1202712 RepID=A0A318TGQ7_9BACL|nr:hypothetical protein [Ureibacillus chungkukjangi]PYF02328.1 hypothetical protein BJ095_1435 [Ureibacillus chungkukjangi]